MESIGEKYKRMDMIVYPHIINLPINAYNEDDYIRDYNEFYLLGKMA
ncbi:hypothetical protein AGMMS49546_28750 [Spirochaetia bacterium]|nr:hypothetical protein AGMMS49546_28750 [Spirochaetia bacterium]